MFCLILVHLPSIHFEENQLNMQGSPPLWEAVKEVTNRAKEKGSLFSIDTDYEILEDGGVPVSKLLNRSWLSHYPNSL